MGGGGALATARPSLRSGWAEESNRVTSNFFHFISLRSSTAPLMSCNFCFFSYLLIGSPPEGTLPKLRSLFNSLQTPRTWLPAGIQ